jgi:hydroxyacylglutathione hydrolase
MDNYAYILTDTESGQTAIIDASEASPVIQKCEELSLKPSYILTTHHHFDHVGGNAALKQKYNLKIVAPILERDLIEGVDDTLDDGETFRLGETAITAIWAPGHTRGHNLYYIPDESVLFTGDVLFNLCIGGLFEGTPDQMWQSLQKIKSLPDDVLFYPGHEYTRSCLEQTLKNHDSPPLEVYAQIVTQRLERHLPAAPIPLKLEKLCNPYLMIDNKHHFAQLF